ncbi:Haloalkane dehalogenase [Micractinium conductrix]|uniref:Haloalkane dehalogenase n=1 Tax=Micractinium conductrix TaxID=554055 RepID=A0A2P6VLN4_9CHLO|nr:Haloalkane dehalogenase [Micractinium conductrix]|eukprot:PSC74999.1 Haloalkane dehalogenase [Micractinium conductrix]
MNRRELLGTGAAAAAVLGGSSCSSAAAAAATAGAAVAAGEAGTVQLRPLTTELDSNGVERLALQPEGWNSWQWRGHNVNWLQAGDSGPVVVLVHGFGVSVYHWRYNVPELAKTCRVYALDCLGFGWSSKPLADYNGYNLWRDQIADFIREVAGGEPAVLVGNSLGGYNALSTAAFNQDLVRGVVLLNAAGRFDDGGPEEEVQQKGGFAGLVEQVATFAKRAVVFASFVFAKQPARIRQVLNQVYVSPATIDDDLVRSIQLPAQDPNAAEVFYRVITARGEAMNRLLDRLNDIPLYLLWGEKDPWCVPARATQIQKHYPAAQRTDLNGGHCPHDDVTYSQVNENLACFVAALPAAPRRAMASAHDTMQGHFVVSLGEALYDCLADQIGKPKEEVTSWTPYPGGAPANVATGVARLGSGSLFVSAIGKDDLGDQFVALLEERGVDTSAVQRNDRPTRDILVTRLPGGDRVFSGFGKAKTHEYADCFLDTAALPLDRIKAADALVTGTLGLAAGPTADAMRAAVKAAREGNHCTVVLDVNWRPVFWDDEATAKATVLEYIKQAHILKVTDEEAEWLFGIPAADALAHPERVLEQGDGWRGVLVSAGEKGSGYAFHAPGGKMAMSGVVPVLDVKVVDTTGAGDAYLAGFLFYMLLSGGLDSLAADPAKLRRGVEFATACGAFTCTKPGAIGAQPTVAEAEALLAARGAPPPATA